METYKNQTEACKRSESLDLPPIELHALTVQPLAEESGTQKQSSESVGTPVKAPNTTKESKIVQAKEPAEEEAAVLQAAEPAETKGAAQATGSPAKSNARAVENI